jgi:hypothetical protein
MELLKNLLVYYGLGVSASLLIIGFIHLYSLVVETCFWYAEWSNILIAALLSGMPFGIAIWAFITLKK